MTATVNSHTLPGVPQGVDPHLRWFLRSGCVVWGDGQCEVFLGGTLVGRFERGDFARRNTLVVMLAGDPKVTLEKLAWAFGMTSETLRKLRRLEATQGIAALCVRRQGGAPTKVTESTRRRLEEMFDGGMTAAAAHARFGRRARVTVRTVQRVRAAWEASQTQRPLAASPETTAAQIPLAVASNDTVIAPDNGIEQGEQVTREPAESESMSASHQSVARCDAIASDEQAHEPAASEPAAPQSTGSRVEITPAAVQSARHVQHAGTWLLIAMAHRLGLYASAERYRQKGVDASALRIALDATIAALAIGQGCVEGVRRLATPSAPALLSASRAPSASWVRRVLGLFSQKLGGVQLHLAMARALANAAAKDDEHPTVFYVDNHMRPYTGQHTVRKGWRMQDRRALPGCSDYYVHDLGGRPVMRRSVPSHGSLTDVLLPIGQDLREAIDDDTKILLAFDRAGAFPEQLAALRDSGFELLTYQRRPYTMLAPSEFTASMELDDETLGLCESRANLGKERGRVRRISVREEDGRQVNVLAVSDQPAEWLVGVMKGRWAQENGFKHGVERWGVNQLDGRGVRDYPPDTIVPNPARRRLDHALRLAAVREGDLRNKLARLAADDPRRERAARDLDDAFAQRRELEALRPSAPLHAQLKDTELADKLVRHSDDYKITLDTVRIACANAESDLALALAPHLPRPAEAKKVLANLFAAPGRVAVHDNQIVVTLLPAANRDETLALAATLTSLDHTRLTLPADRRAGRPVRFCVQT